MAVTTEQLRIWKQQQRSIISLTAWDYSIARVLDEAIALSQAGAFSIVLEHIPSELAATITETISIPTIGIGAGGACDGQVLVTADLLGLSLKTPPFAKPYIDLQSIMTDAVERFAKDVLEDRFPSED